MNNRVTVNLKPGTQLFHSTSVKEVRCAKISDDVQYMTNDSWASRLDAKQKKIQIAIEHPYKIALNTHNIYKIYSEPKPIIHHKLFETHYAIRGFYSIEICTHKKNRNDQTATERENIQLIHQDLVEIYSFYVSAYVCIRANVDFVRMIFG